MKDVIYFRLNNNGERIQGCVKIKDVKTLMRSKPGSTIDVYSREFVIKYSWGMIRNTTGVQNYIKEHLPEYII